MSISFRSSAKSVSEDCSIQSELSLHAAEHSLQPEVFAPGKKVVAVDIPVMEVHARSSQAGLHDCVG